MKTKAVISFALTASFVFTYANCWFCHDMALLLFLDHLEKMIQGHFSCVMRNLIHVYNVHVHVENKNADQLYRTSAADPHLLFQLHIFIFYPSTVIAI